MTKGTIIKLVTVAITAAASAVVGELVGLQERQKLVKEILDIAKEQAK